MTKREAKRIAYTTAAMILGETARSTHVFEERYSPADVARLTAALEEIAQALFDKGDRTQ